MKKTVFLLLMLFIASVCFAQNVTTFMGIPVDGAKSAMIQKLKAKGFTYFYDRDDNDYLKGEFNGNKVRVFIQTQNNKVWRICVQDENSTDATNIKIRFNNLYQQFEENEKYMQSFIHVNDGIISKDEDISHEILVHDKRYEAAFFQISENPDGPLSYMDKMVWFMIGKLGYNRYVIVIFYENLHNKANGEDL